MITKVITAHLPLALAEQVDQMATSLERSRGWIVKEALSAWVAQEEERRQWTLDALADVDDGHVVDHEAVRTWTDSLGTDTPLALPAPPVSTASVKAKRTSRKR